MWYGYAFEAIYVALSTVLIPIIEQRLPCRAGAHGTAESRCGRVLLAAAYSDAKLGKENFRLGCVSRCAARGPLIQFGT
jgi:hypothetical protein